MSYINNFQPSGPTSFLCRKQLTLIEVKRIANKRIRKAERIIKLNVNSVVAAKVSWCVVLRLSRNSDVEKRLNRRELAYLSA